MVSIPMTLSDPLPVSQGRDTFLRQIAENSLFHIVQLQTIIHLFNLQSYVQLAWR